MESDTITSVNLHFILPVEPRPCERPRFDSSRKRVYNSGKYTTYKQTLAWKLRSMHKGPPIEAPIILKVVFHMRRPKDPKFDVPAVKPDASNLLKAIEDAGNGIVWRDDCQIIRIDCQKVYAVNEPMIEVSVFYPDPIYASNA